MMIAAHPGIEPGATPFVVGGVLRLSSRTANSLKTKILGLCVDIFFLLCTNIVISVSYNVAPVLV